jgi:DNA-binding NarL/FixJ family response regulator
VGNRESSLSVSSGTSVNVRSVLICDDAVGFSVMARAWLSAEPDLEVVGIAHTAAEAVEMAERQRPTVIVLDRILPDVGGVDEVVADLRRCAPGSAIVLTSSLPEAHLARDAQRVGADAAFPKAASSQALIAAVAEAAQCAANGSGPLADG